MDTGNLPSWPGAAVVYSRAASLATEMCRRAYQSQRSKTKKKLSRFHPPKEATRIIDAMNKGDEEVLKGIVIEYRNLPIDYRLSD